jgi:hypothetical protein
MTDANVNFVLLVVAGALLLYLVGAIAGSEGKKRLRSEFSAWSPRHMYIGLICFIVGVHTVVTNIPLEESDPLVVWGNLVLGLILAIIGFSISVKMIKNRISKHDSNGSSI